MKGYLAFTLLPLLTAVALADAPTQDAQKQPRTLGQRAVLHIYYYAPRTLEITYVDSYLFRDEGRLQGGHRRGAPDRDALRGLGRSGERQVRGDESARGDYAA